MYGAPLQGQNRHNSKTRVFFTLKKSHIHVFLYYICRIYMPYHILFVLSYSTHIWNEYAAGNLLKIKNAKNEALSFLSSVQIKTTKNHSLSQKPCTLFDNVFDHAFMPVLEKKRRIKDALAWTFNPHTKYLLTYDVDGVS